jgi:hypothetical protein
LPALTDDPKFKDYWVESLNRGIDASRVGSASIVAITLKCPKAKHIFEIEARQFRTIEPCPYCSNKKFLSEFNDLKSLRPDIAAQLNEEKSGFNAQEVTVGSSKIAWWTCEFEHNWDMTIRQRTGKLPQGCPICSNRRLLKGYNDLKTRYPDLMKHWNTEKNGDPSEVYKTSLKYWWKCDQGHERYSTVFRKIEYPCPDCSGWKLTPGVNDFETFAPKWILSEWSPKNILKPEDFKYGTKRKVHWICSENHEWTESPGLRLNRLSKCPTCQNRRLDPGVNDLETKWPNLSKQWNQKKNLKKPNEVVEGSGYIAHWICPDFGTEFTKRVVDRVLAKGFCTCEDCSKKSSIGEKELRNFVKTITNETLQFNTRGIASGFELDIYIPNLNLALEYNGDYWHSDEVLSRHGKTAQTYHSEKLQKTTEAGIKLIFVWESDWQNENSGVKESIEKFIHSGDIDPILAILSKG